MAFQKYMCADLKIYWKHQNANLFFKMQVDFALIATTECLSTSSRRNKLALVFLCVQTDVPASTVNTLLLMLKASISRKV